MRRKSEKKNYLPQIAPMLSGALLIFCFPRFDYQWLAFVALVPLLSIIGTMNMRQSLSAGLMFGFVYFMGTNYWVYHSIHNYGGLPLWMSIIAAALLAMVLSLFTGVFAMAFNVGIARTNMPAVVLAPTLWVVAEYLRTILFTGYPSVLVGTSQWKFLTLIQVADITGVYGVSFIVVAINGALADIAITRNRMKNMPLFNLRPTFLSILIIFICIIMALVYGRTRLNQIDEGKKLKVAVIQGNIDQGSKWSPDLANRIMGKYRHMTERALKDEPDLIVWPETAVPFILGAGDEREEEFAEYQALIETPILFGAITSKGENKYANSAILLADGGERKYSYDKIHLVPFGEYVPLKNLLFFIEKMVVGIGDYVPGGSYDVGKVNGSRFSTLICYEIMFPQLARKFTKRGTDFMVTVTNDAWFGDTSGPYQLFSDAVFRAVESRKPVVRAANTGISGLIDSRGRVMASSGLFEDDIIIGDITTSGTLTPYARYGDLFTFFCIVFTVVLLMETRRQ